MSLEVGTFYENNKISDFSHQKNAKIKVFENKKIQLVSKKNRFRYQKYVVNRCFNMLNKSQPVLNLRAEFIEYINWMYVKYSEFWGGVFAGLKVLRKTSKRLANMYSWYILHIKRFYTVASCFRQQIRRFQVARTSQNGYIQALGGSRRHFEHVWDKKIT